jgi:hypothetical protein
MSIALEMIHMYARTHQIVFEESIIRGIFFCSGTHCDHCPIKHSRTMDTTCKLTTEEHKELVVTHPEYFI